MMCRRAVLSLLFVLTPALAAAQQSSATRAASSGVYTDDQAERGHELYSAACVGCHAAASHTGPVFANAWAGKLVSELFAFVSARMPKNDPGSLAPEEYANLVAYLLKMNGVPAGTTELPADSVALKSIRIDLASHSQKR